MNGFVDDDGRALLGIELQSSPTAARRHVTVWIDTGFTGELVLPRQLIEELSLEESGGVEAILADGSGVSLRAYACLIEWFGSPRRLEVIANDGDYPLLGVGLLDGRELRIDYRSKDLSLT